MTFIEAPTVCPSCNSVLEEVNHLLYCRNPQCGEKSLKLMQQSCMLLLSFAKKVLNVFRTFASLPSQSIKKGTSI